MLSGMRQRPSQKTIRGSHNGAFARPAPAPEETIICGERVMVGASGLEPPASASRTLRANQAALRPDWVPIIPQTRALYKGGLFEYNQRGATPSGPLEMPL